MLAAASVTMSVLHPVLEDLPVSFLFLVNTIAEMTWHGNAHRQPTIRRDL